MQYSKFNSQTINQLQSLPSLRGDVNEVDRRELLTSEIKSLELKIKSTPPSLRDTSPQIMEGFGMISKTKSFPSLRGNVAECDKGELKKSYHLKNYTQRDFNNAKQLIKPIGNQNKAQIAKYIANKIISIYPDYISLFVWELQLMLEQIKNNKETNYNNKDIS